MKSKFYNEKVASIAKKRWSDFRFDGNTFTTRMDPETQATKYPIPYPVYGKRNAAYDVDYVGGINDSDNTVPVATLDRTGSMYKTFDLGMLPIQFAYLGLGMDSTSRNDAYNEQFVNIMLESLSAAYATQMTDLAFFKPTYVSSVPRMTSGNAARIGFMVWYQSIVQNIASVMAKYNSTMSLVDYMVNMGYNGEAPQITALTNLLKKQNVYSLLEQIGVSMKQEYLDLDWFKETSILNGMQSRVADDAQQPLLSIVGSTYIPTVTVTLSGTTLIDTTSSTSPYNKIDVTVNGSTTTYSVQTLVQHILTQLDPFSIVSFCRQVYAGTATLTIDGYINDLIECLKALVLITTTFRNDTVDLRTFLMLLQDQTQLNRWVYDTPYVKPSRPRVQAKPEYFKIVHDIFGAFGAGGSVLIKDTTTRKWKIYSLWKGGEGIPDYDYFNGGFAIATSVRAIPTASDYLSPDYMFPRMFYRYADTSQTYYQLFCNRLGFVAPMGVTAYSAAQIASSPFLAYLNMLGASDVSLNMPSVTLSTLTTDYVLMSTISKLLMTVFGMGLATYGSGGNTITNLSVDSSIIGFVGREYGNFSEASIEYLTARAPLRQMDKDVNIGFRFGLSAKSRDDAREASEM